MGKSEDPALVHLTPFTEGIGSICASVGLNTSSWSAVVALEVARPDAPTEESGIQGQQLGRLSVWSQLLEERTLYTCICSHYWIFFLICQRREQDETLGVCASAAYACMCWWVWLAMYTSEYVLYTCVYVCACWEYMLLIEHRGMKLWQPWSVDAIFGNSLTIYVENGTFEVLRFRYAKSDLYTDVVCMLFCFERMY